MAFARILCVIITVSARSPYGCKNDDGSVCCVIGVLKAIRHRLSEGDGDADHAVITAAGGEKP